MLNADDFQAVFSQARFKVSCRYFLLLASGNDKQVSRLGLVVAKKNIARAVNRNRLKRLVRTWFRQHKETPVCLDLVVLIRKDADKLSNGEIFSRLAALWEDLENKCQGRL